MPLKELFKKSILEIESEILNTFSLDYFAIGEVNFCGQIIVAFVKFKNSNELKNQWKDINSFITAKYIATVKNEFSKWNFYMFYIASERIEKTLKYEIENNKFSSRKIVQDNITIELTNIELDDIISEHITNDNIQVNFEIEKIIKFKKDPKLSAAIDKFTLRKTKKDRDEDLQDILDLIEKTYKNEIQES